MDQIGLITFVSINCLLSSFLAFLKVFIYFYYPLPPPAPRPTTLYFYFLFFMHFQWGQKLILEVGGKNSHIVQ